MNAEYEIEMSKIISDWECV